MAVLDLAAHYPPSATTAAAIPPPSPLHFFAVFDGHGGGSAAAFAAARLLDCVVDAGRGAAGGSSTLSTSPGPALAAGFAALDEAFYTAVVEEASLPDSGTTALAALVCTATRTLTVANAGDSRAVLCRGGRAVPLSVDHRPGLPAEAARIRAAGGAVCPDGYLNAALGVGRAVGDFFAAGPGLKAREPVSGALTGGPLTAAPDLHSTAVVLQAAGGEGGPGDEFLILACDGLWDALSSGRAVSEVRAHLRAHGDPAAAAAHVVGCALAAQSADNVTAVVVCFSEEGGGGGGGARKEEGGGGGGGSGGAAAPPPRPPPRSLSRGSLCTLSDALASCSTPPPAAARAVGRPGGAVAAAVAAMVIGSGPAAPPPTLPPSAWPGPGGAPAAAALVVAGVGEAAIVGPGGGGGAAVGRVTPVGAGGRGGGRGAGGGAPSVPPAPASAEAA